MRYVAHATTAASAGRDTPERGRAGLLPEPSRTPGLEARFWAKVREDEGPDACWPWTAHSKRGNGRFDVRPWTYQASRIAYWLATGRWPGDRLVLHTCNDSLCCRPDHLLLGTDRDKVRATVRKGRHGMVLHPELFAAILAHGRAVAHPRIPKTHCQRGHPFSPENTRVDPRDGKRKCRACHHERNAARRALARERRP
jgi:hypothetical protein